MSRRQKTVAIALLLAIPVGYAIYVTLIEGTTGGPDFIRAIQSRASGDTISSIDLAYALCVNGES